VDSLLFDVVASGHIKAYSICPLAVGRELGIEEGTGSSLHLVT